MLWLMGWLRRLLRRRVQKLPPALPPPLPPEPEPLSIHIPGLPGEADMNRKQRRANNAEMARLEKARKKHDKFVTPKGELPERAAAKPKPRKKVEVEAVEAAPLKTIDDAEILIYDTHHENRNEDVLYKEAEMYGEFNFRDTILQQLERYFVYLERMKKHDAEAYGFYKQVGAVLIPYVASGAWDRVGTAYKKGEGKDEYTPLSDWFNQTRPSFGCYAYGCDPETEAYEKTAKCDNKALKVWVPKFMYFRKYRMPPPDTQWMSGGDIYTMTIWWDRAFEKRIKYGTPQEFGIFVSRDGKEVIALRHYERGYQRIWSKRKHSHFNIPKRQWSLGSEFERWARESGEDCGHMLTELFKKSVQRQETMQYSMVRVAASKGDATAIFSVNIHRTGYFFQDRDIQLNEEGSRKRIFHYVRPHVRSDGTAVKGHFRGDKEFTWAGYDVKITIPGRDHLDIADFDVGCDDEYWQDKNVKYLDMPELGKMVKGWMDKGVGAKA